MEYQAVGGNPLSVAEFRYLDALFCSTGSVNGCEGTLFSMTGCLFAALPKALSAGLMARTEVAQSRALRQENETFIVTEQVIEDRQTHTGVQRQVAVIYRLLYLDPLHARHERGVRLS